MQIMFTLQIDCESTQRSINDPELGKRAIRGLGEILSETGLKATFVAIPLDLQLHASIYRELEAQGRAEGWRIAGGKESPRDR